jgi:hypothetical protein
MARAALALLFLLLPLGTTPMEGATLLVAAAAMVSPHRATQPLLGPALAIWGVLLLGQGVPTAASLWASTLVAWAWVLLVVAPPVLASLRPSDRTRLERVGLGAAGIAGIWAVVEVGLAGTPPWVQPVDGPFSHHLTLGYALLPALARALAGRRWAAALAIGLGVVCAGSSGPALSAGVLLAALVVPPQLALAGGAVAAVAAVFALAGEPELLERTVLWTAGTEVAVSHPEGAGPDGVRGATALAQARVLPGFHFPLHAHDSALQGAALGGWGAWVAGAWALVLLWRRTDRAGRAGIAAVVVGGLTQDTLGDLEVVRAMCAWALLPIGFGHTANATSAGGPPPASPPAEPNPAGAVGSTANPETR